MQLCRCTQSIKTPAGREGGDRRLIAAKERAVKRFHPCCRDSTVSDSRAPWERATGWRLWVADVAHTHITELMTCQGQRNLSLYNQSCREKIWLVALVLLLLALLLIPLLHHYLSSLTPGGQTKPKILHVTTGLKTCIGNNEARLSARECVLQVGLYLNPIHATHFPLVPCYTKCAQRSTLKHSTNVTADGRWKFDVWQRAGIRSSSPCSE